MCWRSWQRQVFLSKPCNDVHVAAWLEGLFDVIWSGRGTQERGDLEKTKNLTPFQYIS